MYKFCQGSKKMPLSLSGFVANFKAFLCDLKTKKNKKFVNFDETYIIFFDLRNIVCSS